MRKELDINNYFHSFLRYFMRIFKALTISIVLILVYLFLFIQLFRLYFFVIDDTPNEPTGSVQEGEIIVQELELFKQRNGYYPTDFNQLGLGENSKIDTSLYDLQIEQEGKTFTLCFDNSPPIICYDSDRKEWQGYR